MYVDTKYCYNKRINDKDGNEIPIPTNAPFWTPFPGTVTLVSSNFGATAQKLDANTAPTAIGDDLNTGLIVKAGSVPSNNQYKFVIKGFVNPFSSLQMNFVVRHFPKCQNLPTTINAQVDAAGIWTKC